jgi:Ca-activated chloride channel family protein
LAKETGGAYESISPNESGAEVITRSFYKMRGGELRDVKIEWDKKPLWESELPKIIYCGETLRVFAQFQSPPEKPPVLSYVIATEKKELTPTTFAQTDNPIITKLGGAKKYDDTQSHESKLELSLRYQLLTPQTALLLIFENVIKADGTPTLQKVPQMLAAGWGGTSSVDAFACGPFEDAAYDSGCDWYQLSVDVDESECRKMPPSGFRSMESRKKFSPRIDSLENIFQSVRDAKSNDDDEKLARKLWKDQNWINKIPSGTVEAEQQITAQTEYQQKLLNFLGMEYKGVGKIVAVNVTIYMVEQYDRVLLGYDETKNIVTIIVYNGSYYASLRDVLNSYISSKVVNKEKLLQDFNLPADAQISAAVLVGRSEQWVEAIFLSYKNLDRLIEKLKVTIIRQH